MPLTLIQHVDPEPDWPELGFTFEGEPIRLADVEERLPAGNARAGVYYLHPTKPGVKVWPWKDAGYYVDSDGEVLAAVGPVPMPLAELVGLGLTDELLFSEHAAYYAHSPPRPHPHGDVDTPEVQQVRRRVFDETMKAWYGEPPMKRLHP
jgi:hypothetical protein